MEDFTLEISFDFLRMNRTHHSKLRSVADTLDGTDPDEVGTKVGDGVEPSSKSGT